MADTLKYFLLYSIENINELASTRGAYTAGEDRLLTCFNATIQQVQLTDEEEGEADLQMQEIDRIFNLAKNN